jgi:hypothetical protein
MPKLVALTVYMTAQYVERSNTYIRNQRHENRKSFKTGDPANSGLSKMQLFLGQSTSTSGIIDTNELEKVREALLPLFQKTGPKPSYTVDEHWWGDTATVRVSDLQITDLGGNCGMDPAA